MLRVTVLLSAGDRQVLLHLVHRDPNWRVRERAQSVLLLAAGMTCQQVADQQELSMQTVSATRRRWLAQGLAGLPDRARSGAPSKLTAAETHRLWCTCNAFLFVGFLGLLRQQVPKPLTIILDNAPFHTARAIQPLLEVLRRQGVTRYLLPPYSPELNRIEQLWHWVKHTWMAAKHRDAETLEADVSEILDNVGSRLQLAF